MPASTIRVLTVVLAVIVIAAFVMMLGGGVLDAWRCAADGPGDSALLRRSRVEEVEDPYTYVATALGALVGGVVAVAFGQPPSQGASRRDPRSILISTYAAAYVLIGVAAVVAWVLKPPQCTPLLVKTLATTFLGLLLPVVANYFRQTR